MLVVTRPTFLKPHGPLCKRPRFEHRPSEPRLPTSVKVLPENPPTSSKALPENPWLDNPFDTMTSQEAKPGGSELGTWDIPLVLPSLTDQESKDMDTKFELLTVEMDLDMDLDMDLEQAWNTLQTTWQFDTCHLPATYARQTTPIHIPSIFVFLGAVTNILRRAGWVAKSIRINQLFTGYLTHVDSNPSALFYINHTLDVEVYQLRETRGQVVLHVKCQTPDKSGFEYVKLTPQNVFGVDAFVLNQSYAITDSFRDRFTAGQKLILYVRDLIRRPETILGAPTVSEAVDAGTSFDLFFPKITQPQLLARQFEPPPTDQVKKPPSLGRKVYVGFMAVLIGVTEASSRKPLPMWVRVTPKLLLCAGSFTGPAFPTTVTLPPVSQITHMWTTFESMATLRRQTDNATPIVGWALARALAYAQEVRRYYAVSKTPNHLVQFKMLCVAWQLLQVMFVNSRDLYSLMVRSFCYSAIYRTRWYCVQKTIQRVQVQSVPDTHPANQSLGVVAAWNVMDNKYVQEWLASQAKPVRKGGTWSWRYMCPFTTFVDDLEIPRIQLGPAFKVKTR